MSVASFSQYTNLDQDLDTLREDIIIQTQSNYVVENIRSVGNFEFTVLVLTETDEKDAEQCLNLLDPREEAQPEGI